MLVIASCVHWDAQPKPEVLVRWIGLLPSGLFRLTPVFSYFLTDMNRLYVIRAALHIVRSISYTTVAKSLPRMTAHTQLQCFISP